MPFPARPAHLCDLRDEDIGEIHELHRVSRVRAAAFVGHQEIGFRAVRCKELDGDAPNVGRLIGERTGLAVRKTAGDAVAQRLRSVVSGERTVLQGGRNRFENAQRTEGGERLLLVLTPVDAAVQMGLAACREGGLLRSDFVDEGRDDCRVVGLVDPAGAAFV